MSFRQTFWVVLVISLSECFSSLVKIPILNMPSKPAQSVSIFPEILSTQNTETSGNLRMITVLYTNDEHGWMGGVDGLGAANLMAVWQDDYNYSLDNGHLILSGGDMWSGAAISTWFEGASMVQTMNAMGYRAAALGNHEFDFGLDKLAQRVNEMAFPLLSANIRYKSSGEIPTDLGIQAFTVLEVSGVSVGIIGLTTTSTPESTLPDVVAPFDFIDHEVALREVVPQVREAGADMIMVLSHACPLDVFSLAHRVADLDINFIGGGHCHNLYSVKWGEMVILSGGSDLQSFAYVEFLYDVQADKVTITEHGVAYNRPQTPIAELSDLIDIWHSKADTTLGEVIGYTEKTIPQHSRLMNELVLEPWLLSFPHADVALSNTGGIRADIKAGEITVGDIITVLPFDNRIIELELTGEELSSILVDKRNKLIVAGLTKFAGKWFVTETGEQLNPEQHYSVLINSFIYTGGDGYNFSKYTLTAFDTTVLYHEPLLDWLRAQGTNESMPINEIVETLRTPTYFDLLSW